MGEWCCLLHPGVICGIGILSLLVGMSQTSAVLCVRRQIPSAPPGALALQTHRCFWKLLEGAGNGGREDPGIAQGLQQSRCPFHVCRRRKWLGRLAGGGLDQKAGFTGRGLAGPASSHVQLHEEEKGAGFSGNFHSLQ